MLNINKSHRLYQFGPTHPSIIMPALYGIHTSTTKFILLIEYNVEQLAGHCVIMIDIAV